MRVRGGGTLRWVGLDEQAEQLGQEALRAAGMSTAPPTDCFDGRFEQMIPGLRASCGQSRAIAQDAHN